MSRRNTCEVFKRAEKVRKRARQRASERERDGWAVVACPQCPENLSQIQEVVLLLEADMCVKEVEGAQGQESPYRQEKACGGDGGVEVEGLGSCLIAVCSTHTHRPKHTDMLSQLHSPQVLVPISPRVGARDKPVPKHACTHTDWGRWFKTFYYMQQCRSAYGGSAKCAVSHCRTSTSHCTSAWVGESVAVECFTAPEVKMKCSILCASIGFWCVGEFG